VQVKNLEGPLVLSISTWLVREWTPGPPCIVSKLWVLTEIQYGIFCITIYTWIVDSLRLNKSQGL
jgi:hypothetical protein